MRSSRFILVFGLSIAGVTLAHANTLTCPIGGEVFEVKGDQNCAPVGLKTMDFHSVTNCENEQTMPQCPQNLLPVYREFTADERKTIETAMEGELYQSAATHSRHYLAYILESEIVPSGEIDNFFLLLDGYWSDFEQNLKDADYTAAFEKEFETALSEAPVSSRSYIYAIASYYALKREDMEKSQSLLDEARALLTDENNDGFIETYLDKITACLANPNLATCKPDSPIMGNF